MAENYQCPSAELLSRMGQGGGDFCWITIVARELVSQAAFARSTSAMEVGKTELARWRILTSRDISENVQHTWGKYESVSGKIQEMGHDLSKNWEAVTGIGGQVVKEANKLSDKSTPITGNDAITSSIATMNAQTVAKTKLDSSVVYLDSPNRTFQISLDLFAFSDPKKEVYDPIRKFMELSCPSQAGALLGIEFPAVFSLRSEPAGVLSVKYAALTSAQPTWIYPFKAGYPMSASVDLQFTEISPLYRQTLNQKNILNVTTKG